MCVCTIYYKLYLHLHNLSISFLHLHKNLLTNARA
nr:MAG TPA: hypothetical protein [Caudoviricetes sp.]